MSRQFGERAGSWDREGPLARWRGDEWASVDLVEHDGEFVATVDLPGFDREDVTIRVTDHSLRIDAERAAVADETADEGRVLRHESVERSIRLPDEVDTEAVTARIRNGVLAVDLPKREATEARTVEVE
jgi:HSP20 family protein